MVRFPSNQPRSDGFACEDSLGRPFQRSRRDDHLADAIP
jgi:hypothetical protein